MHARSLALPMEEMEALLNRSSNAREIIHALDQSIPPSFLVMTEFIYFEEQIKDHPGEPSKSSDDILEQPAYRAGTIRKSSTPTVKTFDFRKNPLSFS